MIRYGRSLRTYVQGGRPFCDVLDESSGAMIYGCPFLCLGGSGAADGVTAYFPPAQAAQSEVALGDGARIVWMPLAGADGRAGVVLGAVMHRNTGQVFHEEETHPEPDEDYPWKINTNDVLVQNGKAFFVISNFGDIVLDTSQASKPVRLQLSATGSGHVRISQDGDADDRLLLAGPTRKLVDDLISKVNDLEAKLAKVYNAVASAGPGTDAGYNAFQVLAKKLLPPLVPTTMNTTTDGLEASAIKISSRSIENDYI